MTLPDHFWWGCTSSSVGAEGVAPGADWSRWERDGRAPRSGEGSGFGTNFADDLTGMASLKERFFHTEKNLRHSRQFKGTTAKNDRTVRPAGWEWRGFHRRPTTFSMQSRMDGVVKGLAMKLLRPYFCPSAKIV